MPQPRGQVVFGGAEWRLKPQPRRFAYPQFCANSSAPAWVNFTEVPDAREELCLAHALNIVDEFARCSGSVMHREVILEELGRVERDVVEGERQLAEQEALLVALKGQNLDLTEARALLEMMRENQQRRDQDRQRLLSLLQP